jgi:methylated-DNA-[protein]-cysteine S-methyltransferase
MKRAGVIDMSTSFSVFPTPIGALGLLTVPEGIVSIGFTDDPETLQLPPSYILNSIERTEVPPVFSKALAAYFEGDLEAIDALPIVLSGSEFQRRAWTTLRSIPAGMPITYRSFAEQLGSTKAFRAAGTACARNPIALLVPCHRVKRTDGMLGGYYWGLDRKQWLLDHEHQYSKHGIDFETYQAIARQ